MSVAVLSGTSGLPDPGLSFVYSRAAPFTTSLPSRPALPAGTPETQTSFTRPVQKSYTIITEEKLPATVASSNHRHSRTVSSSTLPTIPYSRTNVHPTSRTIASPPPLPTPPRGSVSHSRQSSHSKASAMQRQGTVISTNSAAPRRSTSSRSTATNSPTSYVALMRKQKATVWCDRAQSIDQRMAAAQKAAKHRAHLEVAGNSGPGSGRTSTINSGGVVGKIRHGGVPKAPGYVPANMTGAGVPMRLSANEMLGDEEEQRSLGDNNMMHARTDSGRSSSNSAKYRSGPPRSDQTRNSNSSTPPSGNEGAVSNRQGMLPQSRISVDGESGKRDYFSSDMERSGSGNSEDSFGEFTAMSGPNSQQQALAQAKKAEDLRRRGSVDERTTSMGTGVRLFVANPDLDD